MHAIMMLGEFVGTPKSHGTKLTRKFGNNTTFKPISRSDTLANYFTFTEIKKQKKQTNASLLEVTVE